ncbi:MAG: polysaccharide biosynthesis protein [Clostridia bacterium]|nr:polysaccharide biosynthesis protein [Clostridia bacterium]
MKKVIFISSTGGHLNELLQLKSLFSKYDSYIITEKDKTNENLKKEYGSKLYFLPYGTRSKLFTYIFKYLYLCLKTIVLFIKIRPKYIVSTGTHTAVPMCYLGKLFGCKIIFIETFANSKSKTLSGRMVYPIANLFIVQWKEMLKLYPKAVYGGSIYK